MSDAPAWLRDRASFHATRLNVLSRLPDDATVICPVCQASNSRSTILCGCNNGTTTAKEAREFHFAELAILEARQVRNG